MGYGICDDMVLGEETEREREREIDLDSTGIGLREKERNKEALCVESTLVVVVRLCACSAHCL